MAPTLESYENELPGKSLIFIVGNKYLAILFGCLSYSG